MAAILQVLEALSVLIKGERMEANSPTVLVAHLQVRRHLVFLRRVTDPGHNSAKMPDLRQRHGKIEIRMDASLLAQ